MIIHIYYFLHVFALLLLTAVTFSALAAPTPERRKKALMWSGILSLLMLTGGFGLLARLGYGFPLWIVVKLICWLVLSALAGFAFRKPQAACKLSIIAGVALAIGVFTVYWGRFL